MGGSVDGSALSPALAGSSLKIETAILGLAPQALCLRLLRRLRAFPTERRASQAKSLSY